MSVRLVDSSWDRELRDGLAVAGGTWRVACPFVKAPVVISLLQHAALDTIHVVTRFNLRDFAAGVSDIAALRAIIQAGGEVRGLRGLHSKVFVFGSQRAAVTSANLTHAALGRNAEFGCSSDDPEFVTACASYVEKLWERASPAATLDQLDTWEGIVAERLIRGGRPDELLDLPDYGADAREPVPPPAGAPAPAGGAEPGWPAESRQAFVKFFGEGHNRAPLDASIIGEIGGAGCHWACTYPKSARPRTVRDGDTMFMGRMTHTPNDTMIFGRAIALAHVDARDTASAADIAQREWKAEWPHYIRVHHAEFIAGHLPNGISLNALMNELGPHSFASTQRHLLAQDGGNTNPRKALMQQPAAHLTAEAFEWLTARFERALADNGRVPADTLARLDWPEVTIG
jgi:hypothetical protein